MLLFFLSHSICEKLIDIKCIRTHNCYASLLVSLIPILIVFLLVLIITTDRHFVAWMVDEGDLSLLPVQGNRHRLLPVLLVCSGGRRAV